MNQIRFALFFYALFSFLPPPTSATRYTAARQQSPHTTMPRPLAELLCSNHYALTDFLDDHGIRHYFVLSSTP